MIAGKLGAMAHDPRQTGELDDLARLHNLCGSSRERRAHGLDTLASALFASPRGGRSGT